jgi:hypothetical protein
MTYSARFIEEPPELTPRHAAMFYAHCNNTVGDNPVEYVPHTWSFPMPIKYPDWMRPSPYLAEMPLPAGVGPLWDYELLTAPPQAFAPWVADIRVRHDRIIPLIPDICGYAGLGIVSERALHLLEELFPGGSYFWPARILSKGGTPLDRPFFHWVQRHNVTFRNVTANTLETEQGRKLPCIPLTYMFDAIHDRRGRYDILHNSALRDFLQTLPFWAGNLTCDAPVYRAETFRVLKTAGLTGLREVRKTHEDYQVKRGEFIGVIP